MQEEIVTLEKIGVKKEKDFQKLQKLRKRQSRYLLDSGRIHRRRIGVTVIKQDKQVRKTYLQTLVEELSRSKS